MGKKNQQAEFPINAGDVVYMLFHLLSQILVTFVNFFESLAMHGVVASRYTDAKRLRKAERKDLETSVMYDLAHLEVTDG